MKTLLADSSLNRLSDQIMKTQGLLSRYAGWIRSMTWTLIYNRCQTAKKYIFLRSTGLHAPTKLCNYADVLIMFKVILNHKHHNHHNNHNNHTKS